MAETDFEATKGKYQEAREQERRELATYLEEHLEPERLCVVSSPRAGKGWVNYTSGKRIKKYDLSNWKWVEITDDSDFECIVSLNMPDVDPRSGNSHVLFDRIGLLVSYRKDGHYYETAIHTNIDLPLDDTAKAQIAQLVKEQYDAYCGEKKEGSLTDEKTT